MTYRSGMDVLGGAEPQRLLCVRIENAADLAAASSSLAGLASQYAPDTIESLVYDEVASEVGKALREKGAKVDVRVVSSPKEMMVKESTFLRDVIVGVLGGIGAGAGLLLLLRKRS